MNLADLECMVDAQGLAAVVDGLIAICRKKEDTTTSTERRAWMLAGNALVRCWEACSVGKR